MPTTRTRHLNSGFESGGKTRHDLEPTLEKRRAKKESKKKKEEERI